RIQALHPSWPPQAQALLDGHLDPQGSSRSATVLLVGGAGLRARGETLVVLAAWHTLASAAYAQGQHHGALIYPCGDALLLVFGVFDESGGAPALRAALETAQILRQGWENSGAGRGPLSLCMASGAVVAGLLPGLGYSVMGPPIEQALRLQHLA